MDESDYPAMYQASNEASLEAQRRVIRITKFYGFLLLLAAALSGMGLDDTKYSYLAGLVLIISIVISIIMLRDESQEKWYKARAVAESVKTTAWRYMIGAEPFRIDGSERECDAIFLSRLRSLLREHTSLSDMFGGRSNSGEQITKKMRQIRKLDIDERLKFYLDMRIVEQQEWYKSKAKYNRRSSIFWFGFIVVLHVLALVMIFLRVEGPDFYYYPVDFLLVGAAVALSWVQLKRFKELASAYGFTEQEIGLVRAEAARIETEQQLAQFVDDSENAFSREHTQWLARKDTV